MHALFFWLFSIGMIICALAVVFNRNAVASALCFTFTIVFMAGLFVMLSAFFLAAVQILVTAGAVMVLFLFIIMLLDLTAMEHSPRHWAWMACSAVLALAFLGLVGKTLAAMPASPSDTLAGFTARPMSIAPSVTANGRTVNAQVPQPLIDKGDDTHQIGRLLFATNSGKRPSASFTTYVAPFEITSLLILVATIGIIVLCKQEDRPRPHRREEITREAPPVREDREAALKS
jgi:NADH-quinone oxidoreductase subunit J